MTLRDGSIVDMRTRIAEAQQVATALLVRQNLTDQRIDALVAAQPSALLQIDAVAATGGAQTIAFSGTNARVYVNGLLAPKTMFWVAAGQLHISPDLLVMADDDITIIPA